MTRAAIWLGSDPESYQFFNDKHSASGLILVEILITGSYIGTFCWSVCYAVDVYSFMTKRPRNLYCYHVSVWSITGILLLITLISLFGPGSDDNTAANTACHKTTFTVLYHLCFLLPILLAMLFLPIIYVLSAVYASKFVSGSGIMAEMERRSIMVLKLKFVLFTLSFYICWFPSVVDLVWVMQGEDKRTYLDVPFGLWMVEAAVNPLQALFNGILYSKSDFWRRCAMPTQDINQEDMDHRGSQTSQVRSRRTSDSMETTSVGSNYEGVQRQLNHSHWKQSSNSITTSDSEHSSRDLDNGGKYGSLAPQAQYLM
jgi:hypothetical protein